MTPSNHKDLDIVLSVFKENHAVPQTMEMIKDDLYSKFIVSTDNILRRTIDKLLKDGLIKEVDNIIVNSNSPRYQITYEGLSFDGYGKQINQNIIINRNENRRALLLTYGTVLAGIYGLVEILKWAIPYFQDHICHCVFFWQK